MEIAGIFPLENMNFELSLVEIAERTLRDGNPKRMIADMCRGNANAYFAGDSGSTGFHPIAIRRTLMRKRLHPRGTQGTVSSEQFPVVERLVGEIERHADAHCFEGFFDTLGLVVPGGDLVHGFRKCAA